jgi:hypothetical protein
VLAQIKLAGQAQRISENRARRLTMIPTVYHRFKRRNLLGIFLGVKAIHNGAL